MAARRHTDPLGGRRGGHPVGPGPAFALFINRLPDARSFRVGIPFGSLNALAMEPLGHIAGAGAAVVGSLSTLISLLMWTAAGQSHDGTALSLTASFATAAALSLLITRRTGD